MSSDAMAWLLIWIAGSASQPVGAMTAPAEPAVSRVGSCSALAKRDFSRVPEAALQITGAQEVADVAGSPRYCQVDGTIMPNVGFTLRLPVRDWNGKYFQAGCGNWCGVRLTGMYAKACDEPLRRGYACLMSDAGHVARPEDVAWTDGQWAYNDLQAELDWGGRASHVSALAGKAIAGVFYGKGVAKSYYAGCSYGGHQAMVLAQRYPWDFDGIVGGGAPNRISGLMQQNVWAATRAFDADLKPLFSQADLVVLHAAALKNCDMDDGVKDGLIGNPRACAVAPAALVCKPGQTANCISRPIAEIAAAMYAGPSDSKGRRLSSGGWEPGTELFWRRVYREDGVGLVALAPNYFRYMGRDPDLGPGWNIDDYDFDADPRRNDVMETLYAADNPDLRRFKAAGGKFINYVGWSDMGTLPSAAIDYYETVQRTMGGSDATRDFFRMFMIPGALHCRGGDGAENIDFLNSIETWVERGEAPDRMIGSHKDETGRVTFTRPVYPYPQMARYAGRGDPNDAASFRPVVMK